MSKPIRLTQDDLRSIVAESVKKVMMNEDSSSARQLQHVIDALEQLSNSGWIPFASPSPSSTEQVVKDNVLIAIQALKKAQAAAMSLYGG